MYKYTISFSTLGTNAIFETSIFSDKNNLSTGLSSIVKALVSKKEGIPENKINMIKKVTRC